MESLTFSIAPDVPPQRLPGWHLFRTFLQKQINHSIKISEFHSFAEQNQALDSGEVDLLYANPYDAGRLIRENNFLAIAQPLVGVSNVSIVTKKDSPIEKVEDIQPNHTVSAAINADMRALGAILLEPASLTQQEISFIDTSNHILAVKEVLSGATDIAMIPTETYQGLSGIISTKLNLLVATEARDLESIAHCFVLSPKFPHLEQPLKDALAGMINMPNGKMILGDLNIDDWKILNNETDVAFMIDLIYALQI